MTITLAVSLEQGGRTLHLTPGNSDAEILEGTVLGTVLAPSRPILQLDDEPLSIVWNQDAKLALWSADFTNQVGFHRLRILVSGKALTFDFRTRTAKATWASLRAMAETCAGAYFAYKRQFTYMSANGRQGKVRLPQVHYGWLRDRLPEIGQLVRAIDARPANKTSRTTKVSTQARHVSVAKTSRLLRDRPHLLEPGSTGPVHVEGKSYWPSRMVVNARLTNSTLEEHAQIAAFLRLLARQCQDLELFVTPSMQREVRMFYEFVQELLKLSLFRCIPYYLGNSPAAAMPSLVQRTDSRYKRLRDLHSEYGADISQSESFTDTIRTNVNEVWSIYQTFIAHVIGNSLGLIYSSEDQDLRKRAPESWSMQSEKYRLYFDTKIPNDTLISWRDSTNRPAAERPDVVLVNRQNGRVILLDAKFKLDAVNERATQSDLFEMQGYLNSYGVGIGGIVFPGTKASASAITAAGNTLIELPISPSLLETLGSLDDLHRYVRESVEKFIDG